MPRCQFLHPKFFCKCEKFAKLNPPITSDAGIRRQTFGGILEKRIDDFPFEFFGEIDVMEGNVEICCDFLRSAQSFCITALAREDLLNGGREGIGPECKLHPQKLMALPFQKVRNNTRIDPPRHRYEDSHFAVCTTVNVPRTTSS